MPIQATCPGCQTTLQVADTARGKQVRCSTCKTVFTAGVAGANGNGSAAKPTATLKATSSTVKSATKPKSAAANGVRPNGARPKSSPAVLELADEDAPPEKKKKKSMLPTCLIGCGVLFLLCGGGGGVGGYFAYKALTKAASDKLDEISAEADKFQNDIKKAAEEQEKANRERAEKERQRLLEEQKNNSGNGGLPPKNPPFPNNPKAPDNPQIPNNPRPPDNPQIPNNPRPPDNPNPGTPKPQAETIQAAAVSIPLGVKPVEVWGAYFTGEQNKQIVVVTRSPISKIRLEQIDLATGNRVGSAHIPSDPSMGVRTLSPDGTYYFSMEPGSACSLWMLPNPKPLVGGWLPKSPKPPEGGGGKENMTVGAHFVRNNQLLTVNGMGQVVLWKVPEAAGETMEQLSFYDPPASVAKYPAGLGMGLTAISPDRKRVAVYNGADGFFLVNTETMKSEGSVKSVQDARPVPSAVLGVYGVEFSPDGKQLATMFHHQVIGRSRNTQRKDPQIIRWDVETKQLLASITDPTKGTGGAGSRIGWGGTEFCWVSYPNRAGSLISLEKQTAVLHATLGNWGRVFGGSPDGKCWYVATGADGNAVLKCVAFPEATLKQTDTSLRLTAEGVIRPAPRK